jgi:predicted nucleic acid-binding protein
MKVAVDTTVLVYLANPRAQPPIDPSTQQPVEHCHERIMGLIDELDEGDTLLIVPTPSLSEVLIKYTSKEAEIIATLQGKRAILIAPFDTRAAIENAAYRAREKGVKRSKGRTKKEVSFDLQILAIAKVNEVDLLLTDDQELRKHAQKVGIKCAGIADLAIPDSRRQIPMALKHENELISTPQNKRLSGPA